MWAGDRKGVSEGVTRGGAGSWRDQKSRPTSGATVGSGGALGVVCGGVCVGEGAVCRR